MSGLGLLPLLALALPADAPTTEGNTEEPAETAPHYFAVSGDFFGDFLGRALGGEVRVSLSLASLVDVGAGVSIGSSPGILLTARVHLPYASGRYVRPFLQARGAFHPASRGYGGGAYGGALIEVGPGRFEVGLAVQAYAPVPGYLPVAVLAMGGYEFDVYPLGGHAASAPPLREAHEKPRERPAVATQEKEPSPATRIRGKVHDLDDKPVIARITLTGPAFPAGTSTTSAEFSFPVTPGDYEVSADAEGFLLRGAHVTIAKGEQQVLDVTLREKPTKAVATLTAKRVEIAQSIQFEVRQARILPESYFVLDAVVDILLRHLEVKQVRIEGHTDNVGGAEFNQGLSEARVQSVMKYLIEKGVDPLRLRGEGFGPTRPIADNKTEAGRAKNRRVQFEIVE